jgi:hypothetical protein
MPKNIPDEEIFIVTNRVFVELTIHAVERTKQNNATFEDDGIVVLCKSEDFQTKIVEIGVMMIGDDDNDVRRIGDDRESLPSLFFFSFTIANAFHTCSQRKRRSIEERILAAFTRAGHATNLHSSLVGRGLAVYIMYNTRTTSLVYSTVVYSTSKYQRLVDTTRTLLARRLL